MLRVRLDYCEVRDGVVLFDGTPLSGIGVEVGSESVYNGRPTGVVTLWLYRDGLRIRSWFEPWFGPEPGTILHEAGDFDSTDLMGSMIFNGARLDGLIAGFHSGGSLRRLDRCSDGERAPRIVSWRPDGQVEFLVDFVEVEVGPYAYRIIATPVGPRSRRVRRPMLRLLRLAWGSSGA